MKETRFIEQNKEKWEELEGLLGERRADPDRLGDLFVKLTDDLSYARTHYGSRLVRVYLNQLAQRIFQRIFRNRRGSVKKLKAFFGTELPAMMFLARKEMLISLVIFVFSFLFGMLSSHYDESFSAGILGPHYVNMTEENIRNNDPMAVYKDPNANNMFLTIALNNMLVAFRTFITGLVLGIGSICIMIYNGIMVGVFQHFFISRDLFSTSFLGIWMHGSIEIPCIIIAGGAGLVMGSGLVFPGTYTRFQALRISARAGIKIMAGISPFIILASFIESYITRLTDTNDLLRLLMILLFFGMMLGYFVILPMRSGKTGIPFRLRDERLGKTSGFDPDFGKIKSSGELSGNAFSIYGRFLGKLFVPILLTSLVLTMLYMLVLQDLDFLMLREAGFYMQKIPLVFNFSEQPFMYPFVSLAFAFVATLCGNAWLSDTQLSGMVKKGPLRMLENSLLSLFFFGLLFFGKLGLLAMVLLLPVYFQINAGILLRNGSISGTLSEAMSILFRGFTHVAGFYLNLGLLMIFLMLLSDLPSRLLSLDLLSAVFANEEMLVFMASGFLEIFFLIAVLLYLFPVFFAGSCMLFMTLLEISEAQVLRSKLLQSGLISDE